MALQLEAGMSLVDALRMGGLGRHQGPGQLAGALEAGLPPERGFKAAKEWLPREDAFALAAATSTGRMDQVLHSLSEHREVLARNQSLMVGASIYPMLILHGALGLLAFTANLDLSLDGGSGFQLGPFMRDFSRYFVTAWVVVFGVAFSARLYPEAMRSALKLLPGFRGYIKGQALYRFSHYLADFLEAGHLISNAFGAAALITPDRSLRRELERAVPAIRNGTPSSELLWQMESVPYEFRTLYRSGEQTGSLVETLRRISKRYNDMSRSSLIAAAFWYPKLFFLLAVFPLLMSLAKVYGGYLDSILNILE